MLLPPTCSNPGKEEEWEGVLFPPPPPNPHDGRGRLQQVGQEQELGHNLASHGFMELLVPLFCFLIKTQFAGGGGEIIKF